MNIVRKLTDDIRMLHSTIENLRIKIDVKTEEIYVLKIDNFELRSQVNNLLNNAPNVPMVHKINSRNSDTNETVIMVMDSPETSTVDESEDNGHDEIMKELENQWNASLVERRQRYEQYLVEKN